MLQAENTAGSDDVAREGDLVTGGGNCSQASGDGGPILLETVISSTPTCREKQFAHHIQDHLILRQRVQATSHRLK